MYLPVFLSVLPYLDPGSGSILIQVLIAVLLGAGVFVRSQWARIKRLFGAESKDASEDNDEDKNAE